MSETHPTVIDAGKGRRDAWSLWLGSCGSVKREARQLIGACQPQLFLLVDVAVGVELLHSAVV
jgi:hypothetical protein